MGKQVVTVAYWRGTTQYVATARTYAGAKRIASLNQNASGPTFWEGNEAHSGRELYDDGLGLLPVDGDETYVL